jgi:hypothetical protein
LPVSPPLAGVGGLRRRHRHRLRFRWLRRGGLRHAVDLRRGSSPSTGAPASAGTSGSSSTGGTSTGWPGLGVDSPGLGIPVTEPLTASGFRQAVFPGCAAGARGGVLAAAGEQQGGQRGDDRKAGAMHVSPVGW